MCVGALALLQVARACVWGVVAQGRAGAHVVRTRPCFTEAQWWCCTSFVEKVSFSHTPALPPPTACVRLVCAARLYYVTPSPCHVADAPPSAGSWQGLPVAVKTVVFTASEESRRRALQEAALCQSVAHPNIGEGTGQQWTRRPGEAACFSSGIMQNANWEGTAHLYCTLRDARATAEPFCLTRSACTPTWHTPTSVSVGEFNRTAGLRSSAPSPAGCTLLARCPASRRRGAVVTCLLLVYPSPCRCYLLVYHFTPTFSAPRHQRLCPYQAALWSPALGITTAQHVVQHSRPLAQPHPRHASQSPPTPATQDFEISNTVRNRV